MSEENNEKLALVPWLRFPEFREKGGWTTVELGTVTTITTEKVGSNTCIPMSITSGVGLVSQEDKFGRVIAGDSYKNYVLLKPNDFAYNKSATKEYPEGFLALYSGRELAAVPNSIFTCFRVKGQSPVPTYLKYLFLGNLHGQWLRKFIQVGARAHGSLSINDSDLMALPVPLPTGESSIAEQQKIADCLSSLDELIAVETQKLDALKTHKKGLMQQLFPREGETTPCLRFPEFRDSGGWVLETLGDIGETISGLSGKSAEDFGEGSPFITYRQIFEDSVVDLNKCGFVRVESGERQNEVRYGDILITGSSETPEEVGFASVVMKSPQEKTYLNSFCFGLRLNDPSRCVPEFLRYTFHSPIYRAEVTTLAQGSTRFNISKSGFLKIRLPIPVRDEQQKIADCLSSLDDLIVAKTQKIDALKIHKKGLMQQLFPVLDEVSA